MQHRVDDDQARQALNLGTGYTAPVQTMHRTRKSAAPTAKEFDKIFEARDG